MVLEDWLVYTIPAKQGPKPNSNDGRVARIDNSQEDYTIGDNYEASNSMLIDVRGFRFVATYLTLTSNLDSIDWKVLGTSKEYHDISELKFSDFDIEVIAQNTDALLINDVINLPNAGKSGVSSAIIIAIKKNGTSVGQPEIVQAVTRVRQNL